MVLRTRNGPKLCERPPCARGMPREQPRPKTSAPTTPSQNRPAEKGQNGVYAIALVGGWGEVGPPDSEWAQTLRASSVCPRDASGTATPKNECPNYPVPKPPSGKGPKRGVCYSLGGGGGAKLVRRTRNGAKLCDRPPCVRGMPRAWPRPKTSARRPPSQNRPAEKGQNGGCAIALVGGCGEVGPPDSEWPQTLRAASVCPRGAPGHGRAQKRAPQLPRPKTAQRKRAKTGGVL